MRRLLVVFFMVLNGWWCRFQFLPERLRAFRHSWLFQCFRRKNCAGLVMSDEKVPQAVLTHFLNPASVPERLILDS